MTEVKFTHPFIDTFPGDESYNTMQRQTPGMLYSLIKPFAYEKAELITFNATHAEELGFEVPLSKNVQNLFNALPNQDIITYATAYAGHQFGNWAGQLGDGRAIFIGEILAKNGRFVELQWKGAGATPYSRHADGRAVLRSTIREYLMSEAMHHLGVPTSRALSLSLTGENVMRDIMYDGNPAFEKGAVMIRTAPSFLRFGHFEFLAAAGEINLLKQLADWTIQRYFNEIKAQGKDKYLDFFRMTRDRTINMIIHWLRTGFVHGVMNTDNMSVLGLTIDYGPFALMEEYDLQFTPNTTDLPGRRYAFGRQGNIALWNLNALANALYPLINEVEALQAILNEFESMFWTEFDRMMLQKLGLNKLNSNADKNILKSWQKMMIDLKPDYTLFFSELLKLHSDDESDFNPENFLYFDVNKEQKNRLDNFMQDYKKRVNLNIMSKPESKKLMNSVNPKFVLRNYQLYQAAQNAEEGDFSMFFQLEKALKTPYKNHPEVLLQKRPEWAEGVPGCSMLSCSS